MDTVYHCHVRSYFSINDLVLHASFLFACFIGLYTITLILGEHVYGSVRGLTVPFFSLCICRMVRYVHFVIYP